MLCFLLIFLPFHFLTSIPLLTKSDILFSPRGNITTRIIEEIEKAEKEIRVAVYMITRLELTDALIKSHKKGVSIKVVTDTGSINSPYGKIYHLVQAGIDVKVFLTPDGNSPFPPLMHSKYTIIDQKVLIDGSFNWTKSAELFNEEHVRVTTNKKECTIFSERFKNLFETEATDQFTCHKNQMLSWNKKNRIVAKTDHSSSSDTRSKSSTSFSPDQSTSAYHELSQLLWSFLSISSPIKNNFIFQKKVAYPKKVC